MWAALERCVFPLSADRIERTRGWASRLLDPPADRADSAEALTVRGNEAVETLFGGLLPDLLASPLASLTGAPAPNRSERRTHDAVVAKALDVIDAARDVRPTIEQLAGEVGVSRRTLEFAFRAVLGCSPSRFFRVRRLARVRRDLLRGASVTEAALAHQFVSLGRFAELYRRQFGELPSDTDPRLVSIS